MHVFETIMRCIFVIGSLRAMLAASGVIAPLEERRLLSDITSCNRIMPNSQKMQVYREKAEIAVDDAKSMLDLISQFQAAFFRSTAYSHYFRPDDREYVRFTYSSLNLHMSLRALHTKYHCGNDQKRECAQGFQTLGFTDPWPGAAITFCDSVFRRWTFYTRPLLPHHARTSWCSNDSDYERLRVDAEPVIQQVAQLDEVGAVIGARPWFNS